MNRNKPTKVKTLSPPLAEVMILYIHFHIPLFFFLHWTNDFTNSFIYPTGLFHIETMIYIFIYISHLFHIVSMISNTYPTEACFTLNQWFQLHIQLRFVSHWNNDFSYISNWCFFFSDWNNDFSYISDRFVSHWNNDFSYISNRFVSHWNNDFSYISNWGFFHIETMISVTYPTEVCFKLKQWFQLHIQQVCFTLNQWFQLHIQLRFVSHWNNGFSYISNWGLFHIETIVSETIVSDIHSHIPPRFISHWNNDFRYPTDVCFTLKHFMISDSHLHFTLRLVSHCDYEFRYSFTYPRGLLHNFRYIPQVYFTSKQCFQIITFFLGLFHIETHFLRFV